MTDRALHHLAVATVLVLIVGVSFGFDEAMVVAFSLAVIEIDARCS